MLTKEISSSLKVFGDPKQSRKIRAVHLSPIISRAAWMHPGLLSICVFISNIIQKRLYKV